MGGLDEDYIAVSSVELVPRPPSDTCSIPDLPQPRWGHSLSLLPGGRLVVCGGRDSTLLYYFDACISWVAGNTSWTPKYTLRCLPIIIDEPAGSVSSSDKYLYMLLIMYSVFVKFNKKIKYPAGVLCRRLLHRNGNFVPPAPGIRTRRRMKNGFWRKTGRGQAVYESIRKVPSGKTTEISVALQP